MIYALDSNIVSYMLKGDAEVQRRFVEAINKGCAYAIVPLVYYEVKRGLTVKKATSKLSAFARLCESGVPTEMDVPVWERAIDIYAALRERGTPIDDADLFIAAHCIVNGYVLVTNNMRHFKNIDDLKLINWK
jgi:predicted nucleic acid-binding protein